MDNQLQLMKNKNHSTLKKKLVIFTMKTLELYSYKDILYIYLYIDLIPPKKKKKMSLNKNLNFN